MITEIYNLIDADAIIIVTDDDRFLGISNKLRGGKKKNLCQQLKDIKRANIPEKDISLKDISLGKSYVNIIYDIRKDDGQYCLFFTEEEQEKKITIPSEELKNLLNCLEEKQASKIS